MAEITEETARDEHAAVHVPPAHAERIQRVSMSIAVNDSAGIFTLAFAVLLIGGLGTVGIIVGFADGHPLLGGLYMVGGLLVLGCYLLFIRHVVRWYRRTNTAEAAAYEAWSAWLFNTYGLRLTDAQNDALVNYQDYVTKPSFENIWGKTSIMVQGTARTIRLVGDETAGYQLEGRAGNTYGPLPTRS